MRVIIYLELQGLIRGKQEVRRGGMKGNKRDGTYERKGQWWAVRCQKQNQKMEQLQH